MGVEMWIKYPVSTLRRTDGFFIYMYIYVHEQIIDRRTAWGFYASKNPLGKLLLMGSVSH